MLLGLELYKKLDHRVLFGAGRVRILLTSRFN